MTEREAAQLRGELQAARKEAENAREQQRKAEERLAQRDEEIVRLTMKVQALILQIFGKSSEKLDPAQLQMLLDGIEPGKEVSSGDADAPAEDDDAKKETKKRRARSKERKPRYPQDLEVVIQGTVIPPEVLANPEEWVEFGEEHSDLLDYVPERFRVLRTVLKQFKHREDRERPPLTGAAPALPIPGARCSVALIAQILYCKFVLHLPLYRQQSDYEIRHLVHLPRSTLNRWVFSAAERLKPIGRAIELEVLGSNYQQIDETPHRYLNPGQGRTSEGRMWVFNVPKGSVCYQWYTNRGHRCLEEFLVDPESGEVRVAGALKIQCDAWSAYLTFARKYDGVELVGCLAHVRRYFHDAMKLGERRYSPLILKYVENLYAIETRLRKKKAGPALREAVRASESLPILRRLNKILAVVRQRTLPAGALGTALNYALKLEEKIEACFTDGRSKTMIVKTPSTVPNGMHVTAITQATTRQKR